MFRHKRYPVLYTIHVVCFIGLVICWLFGVFSRGDGWLYPFVAIWVVMLVTLLVGWTRDLMRWLR